METRSVKLTIGMPVYNGSAFIVDALRGILNQTFTDFELIISDNASTDPTEEICRTFQKEDSRIRYVRNEQNLGAAKNFNRVFELSCGKYFKWAASDDICLPDMLNPCVQILDTHPEVILCYPKTRIIDATGRIVSDYNDGLNLQGLNAPRRFIQLYTTLSECNAVFGLIRREVLRKTPLIGNYIGSDTILLAELSLYGEFFECPEFLFHRREHPQASSWDKSVDKQLTFFDPDLVGKMVFPYWRRLQESFRAVKRSPLTFAEKMWLYNHLAYQFFWNRDHYLKELCIPPKRLFARLFRKQKQNWTRV